MVRAESRWTVRRCPPHTWSGWAGDVCPKELSIVSDHLYLKHRQPAQQRSRIFADVQDPPRWRELLLVGVDEDMASTAMSVETPAETGGTAETATPQQLYLQALEERVREAFESLVNNRTGKAEDIANLCKFPNSALAERTKAGNGGQSGQQQRPSQETIEAIAKEENQLKGKKNAAAAVENMLSAFFPNYPAETRKTKVNELVDQLFGKEGVNMALGLASTFAVARAEATATVSRGVGATTSGHGEVEDRDGDGWMPVKRRRMLADNPLLHGQLGVGTTDAAGGGDKIVGC